MCGLVACVMLASVQEIERAADLPCVEFQSETWWLDPDEEAPGPDSATFLPELQTRAMLLCYECPDIVRCRLAGATEAHNIWGGLTSQQRRRIARGLPATRVKQLPLAQGRLESGDIEAFRSGVSVEQIAARLGRDKSDVLLAFNRLLRKTQIEWENRNVHVNDRVSFLVRSAQIDWS